MNQKRKKFLAIITSFILTISFFEMCASSQPLMTQKEVIVMAKELARKNKYPLNNYKNPSVEFNTQKREWFIIFHHVDPAPPGSDFGITVDDNSGKAVLFIGE